MSYEEFWLFDYQLTESYVIKNDRDVQLKADFDYTLANYINAGTKLVSKEIRQALTGKRLNEDIKYPEPPKLTKQAKLIAEREKQINKKVKEYIQDRRIRNGS